MNTIGIAIFFGLVSLSTGVGHAERVGPTLPAGTSAGGGVVLDQGDGIALNVCDPKSVPPGSYCSGFQLYSISAKCIISATVGTADEDSVTGNCDAKKEEITCGASCPLRETAKGESIDPSKVYAYGCESVVNERPVGFVDKTKTFSETCSEMSVEDVVEYCIAERESICSTGTTLGRPPPFRNHEKGAPSACGCEKR